MTTPPSVPPPAPLPPARVTTPPAGDRRSLARRRRTRVLAIALALVLVAGLGWAALSRGGGEPTGAARFSTVAAERGSVTQRVVTSGPVAKVNEMSARFPASGTVTELRATVGDSVEPGDVLAVMDDSALRTKVLSAQAAVDAAALTLHEVKQAGRAGPAPDPAPAAPPMAAGGGAPPPAPPVLPDAPDASVDLGPLDAARAQADEAAALVAERTAEAEAALTAMQAACRPVPSGTASPTPSPDPSATGSPTPEPGTSPSPDPSASPTPDPSALAELTPSPTPTPTVDPAACRAAAERVAEAQAAVSQAQAAASAAGARVPGAAGEAGTMLSGAVERVGGWIAAIGRSLSAWQDHVARAQSAPAAQAPGDPSASTGGGSSPAGATTSRSPVVEAEVALARARRELGLAQEHLAAATMRAPMGGVVSSLPWSVGSTADPSERAVVTGSGAVTVTVAIPASTFLAVQPGQQATVRGPEGLEATATVATKALVPDAEGNFPVTIRTTGTNADALASGSSVSVEIAVSSATDVIIVPLSAVQRSGEDGTVRVLRGDDAVDTPVTLGSVGDSHIEVVQGVEEGDRLVVADALIPLPDPNLFGG